MPDFGQCSDSLCNETAVRLFDCAHHCMKMVCLQHLIEHDRLIEQNKRQIEVVQTECKRLYSIYSTLIDENKLRYDYEQKLDDYRRLVSEVNSLLENNTNNIEQFRNIIEKLKKIINEKQSGESMAIVKVEPIDESLSLEKDESIFIGFDRLQNLIIDTDYHRRQTLENMATRSKSESKAIVTKDDGDCIISTDFQTHRIAGQCPLWINGSYGLHQEHHLHRLCRKKRYADLSNHMRQYHGFSGPVANVIARAVDLKVPRTKCLVPNDLQVIDPRRSFLCPFHGQCQYQYCLSASSLRAHLVDVHHMSHSMAEVKIRKLKRLNKNKSMSKITNKVFEIIKKIETERQNV